MKTINQDELIIQMLAFELEEKEEIIALQKQQIGSINGEFKVLSKKRTHLLKDKLDLQNKLKHTSFSSSFELLMSIENLCSVSFFKAPIRKYKFYKNMLEVFNETK